MNPVLAATLRRQWPAIGALVLCALFALVHVVVFQPLAGRYRNELARAARLGLMLDPLHPDQQPPLSPRVFTLLLDNSMAAAEAESRSQSGALTAEMMQGLSSAAGQHGLEVVLAEPAPLTQLTGTVELRAHLRLRGSYAGLVALLDDLARDGKLWRLERFALMPSGPGRQDLEVWIARCVLKRSGGAS